MEKQMNLEKTKLLSEVIKNNIIDHLLDSSETIYESIFGFTACTASEWYKSFIVSDEFQKTETEIKKNSFDQYENLINLLNSINNIMLSNKLGFYSNKN